MKEVRIEWFSNVKNDGMSGIVVAIALIPEAIGFALLAGLSPMVGLYAFFCIANVTSIAGGRPVKAGNLLRFIPSPVMTGFVNALGILIFKS